MKYKIPATIPFKEFIVLMAALMSLSALSIDAMLPAMDKIASDLGVSASNGAQFIISFIFIGLTIGQIFYGPYSDAKGRRKAMFLSIGIFVVGCLISIVATNFTVMLFGRFLQGLGAAGPRIVVLAVVRDAHTGREMAKIMSFVMSIFILVPALAPILGEIILHFSGWESIFMMFIILSSCLLLWFSLRQQETLKKEDVRKFSFYSFKQAIFYTLKTPTSLGYTVTMGVVFGSFIGYLSTAEQILAIQYNLGSQFPLYFALLALAFGVAARVNSKFVEKLGMRYLSQQSALLVALITLLFLPIVFYFKGHPPLATYILYCLLAFFFIGIMFGNFTSIALEPLGHIAGSASAVIGTVSNLVAIPIGVTIGQLYDGTIYPIVVGFGLLSLLSFCIMRYTDAYSSSHKSHTSVS